MDRCSRHIFWCTIVTARLHNVAPHHHQNSPLVGASDAEQKKSFELNSADLPEKDDQEILSRVGRNICISLCSHKLIYIHHQRGSKMEKGLSFFKFFIAEWNHEDMQIPISFTSHMDEVRPEMVVLRDRHNRVWAVKVAKVGGAWYFVDGWDKFVQDNSLATADLLVFEYFSDRLFNVKLYGPNATEKNSVGPSGSVENQGQVSARVDAITIDDDDDVGPSRPVKKRGQVLAKANTVPIDDAGPSRPTKNQGQSSARAGDDEENEADEVNDGAVGGVSNRRQRLRRLHSRCYGMKIFQDGLAQQPANPYFVAKILPKRVADLFIPIDVLKDYNIRLGNEIILVDPSGREFVSKCRVWGDQRTIISGGWRRLCNVNNVAVEDACICEFVKREGDQRQFLHISFVRGAANIVFNHH